MMKLGVRLLLIGATHTHTHTVATICRHRSFNFQLNFSYYTLAHLCHLMCSTFSSICCPFENCTTRNRLRAVWIEKQIF